MCMNYVEDGICHVTSRKCLLGGLHGSGRPCGLQGEFDVWVTLDDKLLVSDIGPPSPEPKRSVALGVRGNLACRIAECMAVKNSTQVITTQQKCRRCGSRYWITDHHRTSARLGRRYFCPNCIGRLSDQNGELDVTEYWCG